MVTIRKVGASNSPRTSLASLFFARAGAIKGNNVSALDEVEAYLDAVNLLDASGAVLYTGEQNLRQGPVYLLGLNPGGDSGGSLRESIASARTGHNAYTDEPWANRRASYKTGQAPLQLRVKRLCEQMGLEVAKVPASNLVFTRSRNTGAHLGFDEALDLCLPAHKIFMDTIRPSFLMTFGALRYFERASDELQVERRDARYGNWSAYRGRARLLGHELAFGNVPHMSYWDNRTRGEIVDWVLERMPR